MYRGISDFKNGYQPRTDIVHDDKVDVVADSCSIVARLWNHFSQLLNEHGINDVRRTETHIATPTTPQPSALEIEMAIEKLKHKSPGFDQIPTELIKAGSRTIRSDSIWNKEELPEDCKKLITVHL